jgi:hypothetical protein
MLPNKALQTDKGNLSCLLHSQRPRQPAFATELGHYATKMTRHRRKSMNCCRVASACLLVLAAAATANAQNLADQLRSAERERLRALVNADIEAAGRLHADDFQLINPLGGLLSKGEYLGAIASGEIDYLSWEPGNIEVKLYGDAAIIRYQAQLQIKVKAIPDAPSGRFWHTDVYERRNGLWQVVWSQATQVQ